MIEALFALVIMIVEAAIAVEFKLLVVVVVNEANIAAAVFDFDSVG